MAFKLPSHLHRSRSGILHFRIAIPPDVRHHFASKEIYRSTGSANVRQAATAAQTLYAAFRELLTEIRLRTMPDQSKAPKRRQDDIQFDLVTKFNFDAMMRPTDVTIQSEPGDAPDAMALAIAAFVSPNGAVAAPAPSKSSGNISEYIQPYLDSTPVEQRPKPKTLESYRAAINTFIKIVGDQPLHGLGIKDSNRFADVIFKLPANSTKLAASRDMSIDDMLLLPDVKPITTHTAKNLATKINAFLEWAFHRIGEKAPFTLLRTTRVFKPKGKKARREFTDDELKILFNPDTFGASTQYSPYMFWVPLIGAHTGARINEIAQLNLSDIVTHDGVKCFSINDEPDPDEETESPDTGKSLKTEAARRLIPIHKRLLDLGLVEYVEELRSGGHVRLFPDLVGKRDGPGQPASKQFGRYCGSVHLIDSRLVFHSLRHGAVRRMQRAHVSKELRKLIVGHSEIEDTHDGYSDASAAYSIADRQGAIETLTFDGLIDYAALKIIVPTLNDLTRSLSRNAKRRAART